MNPILDNISLTLSANLQSEFDTWAEGFDARTRIEQIGGIVVNPYRFKQGALWQQGYDCSRRITELGRIG